VAKYNGPVCRFCRRESMKLFLKGERCYSEKCSFDRRAHAPGQHGLKRGKLSEFGLQLREKQKVRRVYGIFERPFRNIFKRAEKQRGVTSEVFFQNLELRLDNVVFRMGFASSRQDAKQAVRHNHILVNGKRVNIPSATLEVGDEVAVVPKSLKVARFTLAGDLFTKRPALGWVQVDHSKFVGKVIALPKRDDIQLNVKERLIVELYNK
jgi:small subunit ribosomal protein S4